MADGENRPEPGHLRCFFFDEVLQDLGPLQRDAPKAMFVHDSMIH